MENEKIIYDGHIHMKYKALSPDEPRAFAEKAFREAGVGGGLVISPPPLSRARNEESWYSSGYEPLSNRARMDAVLDFCAKLPHYYPCYWIDPTEPDAIRQTILAKELGIRALKVICETHYPAAGLECYRMAAQLDMPILFHCGSLWGSGMPSADFNRPANWECMLDVYGCRFCLAHIGWPWQSECLALYGKLKQAGFKRKDRKCDIYIDCSPGTPEIDRADIFRRFALLGYDLSETLIWGVDSCVEKYSGAYAKWIYDWDIKMFAELQRDWGGWQGFRCEGSFMHEQEEEERDFNRIIDNAMTLNLRRFLGEKV